MRIGLITPGFSASEADWCIPAQLDLVRVLAQTNDVRVIALRYPHRRGTYRVFGAEVHALGAEQSRGIGRIAMWTRALLLLRREHRRRPFDVLHALFAHEPAFLATLAGRSLEVPVAVSMLGGELADLPGIDYGGRRAPLGRCLTQRALDAASLVTVGSEFMRRQAAALGLWDARWRVWPLGVEIARFFPLECDDARTRAAASGAPTLDGHPVLVNVASLVPVKGHATLVRAFARVLAQEPRARLHIVGDGPLRRPLSSLCADLAIGHAVRFHGAVDHGRLPGVYRQSDLFVLSSVHESQCMAMLEAAACGCPAAGTSVGSLPEISSATCEPGGASALADCILTALRARRVPTLPDRLRTSASVDALKAAYSEIAGQGSH